MKYDVIAVSLATKVVRLIAEGETARNADAIMKMAVARRGVDTEFFVAVSAGSYRDGEKWPNVLHDAEEGYD